MRGALLFAAGLLAFAIPAAATQTIVLDLRFDAPFASNSPPFIAMIDGRPASLLPGVVEVNLEAGGVVELGTPNLPTALVSFVVNEAYLARGRVPATISRFTDERPGFGAWTGTRIGMTPTALAATPIGEDAWRLVIPVGPFAAVDAHFRAHAITPYSDEWIPAYAEMLRERVQQHVHGGLIPLGPPNWSGAHPAYDDGTVRVVSFGEPAVVERWEVSSNPGGARIVTDAGSLGVAPLEADLPITEGFFLVVQKDGFAAAHCTRNLCSDVCTRVDGDGGKSVAVTCDLKPLRP